MRTNRRPTVPPVPCIYCASTKSRSKREHVLSRALGTFEHNWVLDCVCDECNHYFADNLELALARDSRESFLRIETGLRPARAALEFLNRRVTIILQDPGLFNGARCIVRADDAGTGVIPVPVAQVWFRRPGADWNRLTERELTPANVATVVGSDADPVEVRLVAPTGECDRLRARLEDLGISIAMIDQALGQPVTQQHRLTTAFNFTVDATIIRAAVKIGFNYAAKILGAATIRSPEFNQAREFVRYGETSEEVARVWHGSILVGPGAATARVHACGLGWESNQQGLMVLVSLFNEMTYSLQLCRGTGAWAAVNARHVFDPLKRIIYPIGIAA
jgi:hypothetical protein